MGYYIIYLDPDTQNICTITLSWGKDSYFYLPVGVTVSPDIFTEKITNLMVKLEYVRTHIDNLLVITNSTSDDHP